MTDARVTALEEKIAHVEHTVGELDATVYRQQQTIDALQRYCQSLEDRLRRLAEHTGAEAAIDQPPPHY